MKSKWLLSFSGLSGLVSVALGAFAAHGLKAQLAPYLLGVFETGVFSDLKLTVLSAILSQSLSPATDWKEATAAKRQSAMVLNRTTVLSANKCSRAKLGN